MYNFYHSDFSMTRFLVLRQCLPPTLITFCNMSVSNESHSWKYVHTNKTSFIIIRITSNNKSLSESTMELLEISSYVLLLLAILLTFSIIFISCYYNKLRDTKLSVIANLNESLRRNHNKYSERIGEYEEYDNLQNLAQVDNTYDHLKFNE